MREISIINDFEEVGGKKFPNWEKRTGFVNEAKLSAQELTTLAGYPPDVEVCVLDSVTDETFFDASFDEDKANAELIGNDSYGYKEGSYDSIGPQRLEPRKGQSWVFVIGCPLHLQ